MNLFGIRLIGIDAGTGEKLLFSVGLLAVFFVVKLVLSKIADAIYSGHAQERIRSRFWTRQVISIVTTVLLLLGFLSIWFDDPKNLATAFGLVTAGLAFALQKVITAFAGYFVILRGKTFNVGDRIVMGGVRGDVISLGFIQTKILEMGEPASMQTPDPIWVEGRQFTGRIVSVSNSEIFDNPVYNYSRDFPLLWEELRIPITYADKRERAEEILLDVARKHTDGLRDAGDAAIQTMMYRYAMPPADLAPRVFYRITDNWLELAVRFVAPTHDARALKDAMSRDILSAFDADGIGIASATYDVVGMPKLRLVSEQAAPPNGAST